MRKALALLLALCSSLLSLLATNEARQGDRLWEPISSPSPPLFASSSWEADLVAAEGIPPVYVGQQDGLKEADKVDALPGQPEGVEFDQYAGYVTVNEEQGRALFYYFVESPHDPSSKPLVLWMNGGPGCSSLGYGAMEELGPFRVKSDGRTLFRNPYSWNEVANVLFLESPAGVGFSYSNTTSDYNQSGDKRSAQDALIFLVNWLERFPQYKTRDFFITGESFAGHYVPQLASAILSYNKMANKSTINLKGIAIGNAYLDGSPTLFNTRLEGYYILLWTHALISDQTYLAIQSSCKYPNGNLTGNCSAAFSKIRSDTGDIDPYNVYWPKCRDIPEKTTGSIEHFDPCSDAYIQFYLNLPEVQKSLHANVTRLPYQWIACSNIVSWSNWKDIASSTLPTIKELVGSGLRVWVYSGDTDAVVSVTSTKLSLKMLQLPVETPWRPWQSSKQVAGYVEGYKGLVFATVRGAGHEVPSYQPERALTLFTSFLQGKLPPP